MQLQLADLGWPQMPKMRETVMTDHNKELAEAFHKFGIRVERALKEAAANLKEALLNYELGDPRPRPLSISSPCSTLHQRTRRPILWSSLLTGSLVS